MCLFLSLLLFLSRFPCNGGDGSSGSLLSYPSFVLGMGAIYVLRCMGKVSGPVNIMPSTTVRLFYVCTGDTERTPALFFFLRNVLLRPCFLFLFPLVVSPYLLTVTCPSRCVVPNQVVGNLAAEGLHRGWTARITLLTIATWSLATGSRGQKNEAGVPQWHCTHPGVTGI